MVSEFLRGIAIPNRINKWFFWNCLVIFHWLV